MQGRKRILSALLLALLLLLPLTAFAAETGESAYSLVIDDEADLLTGAEETDLRTSY